MSDCSSCPSHGGCSSEAQGGCGTGGAYVPTFLNPGKGSRILTVIAVGSGKGGVGKSTVSALLAVMLRREGFTVGILDADITGPSMGQAFGIDGGIRANEDKQILPPRTRLDMPLMSLNLLLEDKGEPVVWRGPIIGGVIKQFWNEVHWGHLDVLILDMPPGTGDVPLTVFQSIPVDRFLVVTTPQDLVRMIVKKACRMAEMMQVPVLGLVENMSSFVCPDCGSIHHPFGKGKTEEAAKALGIPFLDEMPIDPAINAHMDAGDIERFPLHLLQESVKQISELVNRKKRMLSEGGEDA